MLCKLNQLIVFEHRPRTDHHVSDAKASTKAQWESIETTVSAKRRLLFAGAAQRTDIERLKHPPGDDRDDGW